MPAWRAIERWIVEIAGHETRSEPEGASALHHQQGEVAAGAAVLFQGRCRRLRTRLEALIVGEGFVDRAAHATERGDGVAALVFEKFLGP